MNLANLTKLPLTNLTTGLIVAAATASTVMGVTKIVKTVAQTQKTNLPTLTTTSTTPTPTPQTSPNPTSTPTPRPNSNKCIITVDGQQYDVTNLRHTHPGGDIFQCGTDMSAIFHSQHGYDLKRLAPYKLSSTPTNSTSQSKATPMPTASPLPQLSQDRYDNDLDELYENEHRERYERQEKEEHHKEEENKNTESQKHENEKTELEFED